MEKNASDFEKEDDVTGNIDSVDNTGVDDYNSDGEWIAPFGNMTKLAPFKKVAKLRQPLHLLLLQ